MHLRTSARRASVGAIAIALSLTARAGGAQTVPTVVPPRPASVAFAPHGPGHIRLIPDGWRAVEPEVSPWRAFLAAQRVTQIARLRAYAQAGVFPFNRERPGRVNVFVDDGGRLCAVANLISMSGLRALVDRVAHENNFVRFADLSSGPVVDWALSSGLTREEIIRIQEPYAYIPEEQPPQARWQAEQAERTRLQAHFSRVISELEASTDASLSVALTRLGAHQFEPPHELAASVLAPAEPVHHPVVVYPEPTARPVVVYPEPVRRPIRVDPYGPSVRLARIEPIAQPVPVQVQVNVSVTVQTLPSPRVF
jgi:hypothetical protein